MNPRPAQEAIIVRARRLARAGPAALLIALGAAACWNTDKGNPGGPLLLTGAGATFPYPIYSRWFAIYSAENPVRVNYQSVGSGGGIRQLIEGTVDFGATDAPLTEEDLARIPGTLSLPTVIGAVALTYNLPELSAPLRLDGPTIAAIFLGEIARWNDPRLAALNPGVPLPDRAVLPVHRSDGAGTTYVFTDYLATVSAEWRDRVGRGNAVRFPTGLGARGNEGVTGQVRQSAGAIGYVEQVYARQNDLPIAAVRNARGGFVSPTLEAMSLAAAGAAAGAGDRISGGDFRLSLVEPEAEGAYPISSWTYLLVRPYFPECRRAEGILDLIEWALVNGEEDALALGYAPLPGEIRARTLDLLGTVICGPERRPVRTAAGAAATGADR